MRIKPPGEAASPVTELGEANLAEAAEVEEAAALSPSERASGVSAVTATNHVSAGGATDALSEVARRLRAGEIDAREAVELLIDEVVERRSGRVLAERQALADELKRLLRRQTETDPYLAAKVRRLGNRS